MGWRTRVNYQSWGLESNKELRKESTLLCAQVHPNVRVIPRLPWDLLQRYETNCRTSRTRAVPVCRVKEVWVPGGRASWGGRDSLQGSEFLTMDKNVPPTVYSSCRAACNQLCFVDNIGAFSILRFQPPNEQNSHFPLVTYYNPFSELSFHSHFSCCYIIHHFFNKQPQYLQCLSKFWCNFVHIYHLRTRFPASPNPL